MTAVETKRRSLAWIELGPWGRDSVAWKQIENGKSWIKVGYIIGLEIDQVDIDITLAELEAAMVELRGRKRDDDLTSDDERYGPPITMSGGLDLWRRSRYEYSFVAPCGESMEIRAAELEGLIRALRELEPSDL